ncbi:MAG: SMR family transporter [Chthoniobacterales bacterium]
MHHAYLLLALAIFAEVVASSLLPVTGHFTRPLPTLGVLLGYGLAFYTLTFVLERIPLGVTYAMWSGLGIVLLAVIGFVFFQQKPDLPAVVGIALIIAGILVINLFSSTATH